MLPVTWSLSSLNPPAATGEDVGRIRTPTLSLLEGDVVFWEPNGVRDWDSPECAISRLKLESRSASGSGGGRASSGMKAGSSSRMSSSGLGRICQQNALEKCE